MATVERWEMLPDGDYDELCDYFRSTLAVEEDGARLSFLDASFPFDPARGSLNFPDDIRLCRLVTVEVPDAVAMPVEVREAIREALEYTKEQIWENEEPWDAALLDIPYGEALKWLSAQERGGGDADTAND